MSSITVSASDFRTAVPATRLRITARGRRVLLGLASMPLIVGAAFAALSGGAAFAGSEEAAVSFDTVMVMPGDTLWSLAGEVAPGLDPREVIDDIAELNALPSTALMVGQELAIPDYAD